MGRSSPSRPWCKTPAPFVGEALGKANEWNATRRWPRAFVKDGHFFLDFHLDLEKGVHKELLKDVVATVLAGVSQFLLWLGGNGEEDTVAGYPFAERWLGLCRGWTMPIQVQPFIKRLTRP